MSPQALNPAVNKDSTGRFKWTNDNIKSQIDNLYNEIVSRDSNETEFLQAVKEMLSTLEPVFNEEPKYISVMKHIAEPERVIMFKVPWLDDEGIQHVNRGYRVQFSSTLGPYKGGLRFHPSVNLSIIKFLGFEQIFKNALTMQQIGGGKGGSDFDPKGRSDNEIMRFCQSFMTELHRHIGPTIDVPAGDINVGSREIGYMFGQYKKLKNSFEGVLTGKGLLWGGSKIRPEATGYGAVYFFQYWANDNNLDFKDKRCVISGSGNVALYTAEKLIDLHAIPITFSDSDGYIYEAEGFNKEKLEQLKVIKNVLRGRVSDYCKVSPTAKYFPGKKPWEVSSYTMAFPCATQNEIDSLNALDISNAGCKVVVEGANMPSTIKAIEVYKKNNVVLLPAKAANAGGVAVSALEMSQNAIRTSWTREEVDSKLKLIMGNIYDSCKSAASKYNLGNDIQAGANIAGFLKVADGVIEQGCI